MRVRHSTIQGLELIADELPSNIVIRDSTRAPYKIGSTVELSNLVFPRIFQDGEQITVHILDLTEGRPKRQVFSLGIEATVYYKKQDKSVIITIGNDYAPGSLRRDIQYLQRIAEENCGLYEFFVEKRVDTNVGHEVPTIK